MSTRGPTTRSLEERIDDLTAEQKELSRGWAELGNDLK
jgi:hypothetical protein